MSRMIQGKFKYKRIFVKVLALISMYLPYLYGTQGPKNTRTRHDIRNSIMLCKYIMITKVLRLSLFTDTKTKILQFDSHNNFQPKKELTNGARVSFEMSGG